MDGAEAARLPFQQPRAQVLLRRLRDATGVYDDEGAGDDRLVGRDAATPRAVSSDSRHLAVAQASVGSAGQGAQARARRNDRLAAVIVGHTLSLLRRASLTAFGHVYMLQHLEVQ